MKTVIDCVRRVVIPKSIRVRLGLTGGEALEVRERNGVVELEPAPTPMRLRERDGVLVAESDRRQPALTDSIVRETVEHSRRW